MMAADRASSNPTRDRAEPFHSLRQNLTAAVFLTAATDPHAREADARTGPSSVLTR